jgi:hypothetical protein
MGFSVEFLGRGRNAAPEEAATVARLRIFVGSRNATDLRFPGKRSIVDHVIVSVYPLAESLAYRWWTLIYGRGRTTRLRTMRAGFALPDISITGPGDGFIEVKCEPFIYEIRRLSLLQKHLKISQPTRLKRTSQSS